MKIYLIKIYILSRQAISQQQQQQASISAGKELTPAHQASLPQAPRTNPVYQSTGYSSVTPQVSKSLLFL